MPLYTIQIRKTLAKIDGRKNQYVYEVSIGGAEGKIVETFQKELRDENALQNLGAKTRAFVDSKKRLQTISTQWKIVTIMGSEALHTIHPEEEDDTITQEWALSPLEFDTFMSGYKKKS